MRAARLIRLIHIAIQSDCTFLASRERRKGHRTTRDMRLQARFSESPFATLYSIFSRFNFARRRRFIRAVIDRYVDDPRRETLRTTPAYIHLNAN